MTDIKKLKFIQMSDIHFKRHSGDAYDINNPIRKGLLNDLVKAKQQLGHVNGILVCGDIAFSGDKQEYGKAIAFLKEVVDCFDLPLRDVYCVPGNHDINQKLIHSSICVQNAQRALIEQDNKDPQRVDELLRCIQKDQVAEGCLYRAMESYNNAFAEMSSNYTVEKPNWKSIIPLDGKRSLVLYGMNSVLASSDRDHIDDDGNKRNDWERKMIINLGQVPLPDENMVYVSMCHHPPECWNNVRVGELMNRVVKIQLYGHIHMQSIDDNKDRVRIYSGALQPERSDGWEPRYNWIEIYTENDRLLVDIYPRVFEETKFVSDKKECDDGAIFKHCELPFGENNAQEEMMENTAVNPCIENGVRMTNEISREIVYELYQLSSIQEKRLKKIYNDAEFVRTPDGIDAFVDRLIADHKEEAFLNILRGL